MYPLLYQQSGVGFDVVVDLLKNYTDYSNVKLISPEEYINYFKTMYGIRLLGARDSDIIDKESNFDMIMTFPDAHKKYPTDKIQQIYAGYKHDDYDKDKMVKSLLASLNVLPFDLYNLRRYIPFVNVYRYSFYVDDMILKYLGLERKVLSAIDEDSSEFDKLIKNVMSPAGLSTKDIEKNYALFVYMLTNQKYLQRLNSQPNAFKEKLIKDTIIARWPGIIKAPLQKAWSGSTKFNEMKVVHLLNPWFRHNLTLILCNDVVDYTIEKNIDLRWNTKRICK